MEGFAMRNGKIGVGIIGVQPGRSFSAIAHIPALKALPQFEIVAISTTNLERAQAAAREYEIPNAYGDAAALVRHPDVDLVAVTVKVPHHLELVSAAIEAGKAVYCEWPLGNGLAEAEKMADLVKRKKAYAAIGLQARSAPAVNYVRDLVAQDYVGEVLSTTLIGTGLNWGPFMDAPNAYTADRKNGATLLTIPLGHSVDALCYALGEVTEVVAEAAVRRATVTSVETGAAIPMTTEDQIVVGGRLKGGAVIAVHYRGGMPRGTGLLWEINGTKGDLQLTAFGGHAQLFDLSLSGATGEEKALHPLEIPKQYRWVPSSVPSTAYNVAQAYVRVAADLRDGTQTCPGFEEAVVRHRMIAAIEKSADSGKRVHID
jgi:predicted dehydrogenase